jgi:DNA-binding transcriptional LysR family regulator
MHQCLVFRAAELARTWALRGPSGAAEIAVRGRIGADDNGFVRSMIIAGAGIGLLPQINCGADEVNGRLIRVFRASTRAAQRCTWSTRRRSRCRRA